MPGVFVGAGVSVQQRRGGAAWVPPVDYDVAWVADPRFAWQESSRATPSTLTLPVGAWDDIGGTTPLLQATAAKIPTLQRDAGGKWFVRFDGEGDFIKAAYTRDQPYSRLLVCRYRAWVEASLAATDGGTADTAYVTRSVYGGAPSGRVEGYAGSSIFGPALDDRDQVDVVIFEANGASSKLYRNGVQIGSTGNAGSGNAGGLTVGANASGLYPYKLDVYAVVEKAGTWTAGEITALSTWGAALVGAESDSDTTPLATDGDRLFAVGTRTGSLTLSATAPTKDAGNPVLDTLPLAGTEEDHDKLWIQALPDGSGGLRLWLGTGTNEADPTLHQRWAYYTSPDGQTWTRPNMGQVTVGGNTNNNFLVGSPAYFVSLNKSTDGATYLASTEIWDDGGGGHAHGTRLYTSTDGLTWTVAKTLTTASGAAGAYQGEGGTPVQLKNGKWRVYSLRGQGEGHRYISYWDSYTTDPTGLWSGSKDVWEFRYNLNTDRQPYRLNIVPIRGGWLGLVSFYNQSTGLMLIEPWVSGDEGGTWTQIGTSSWLPRGTSGQWDDEIHIGCTLVTLGSGEHLYLYTGGAEDHETYPHTSQVGLASVDAGKLVSLTGTGTWTTPTGASAGLTVRVDCDGTGGTITAAVLDAGGGVISGFADAQSIGVTTDVTNQLWTWTGVSALPAGADKVRFTLTSATLHGVRVSP